MPLREPGCYVEYIPTTPSCTHVETFRQWSVHGRRRQRPLDSAAAAGLPHTARPHGAHGHAGLPPGEYGR